MDLTAYIRDIPDFPKPGILFKDITPLLRRPGRVQGDDRPAGRPLPRAADRHDRGRGGRGFLFAAPLALELNKPLVPLRKPGKLPYRTHKLQYDLEYGCAELHVHIDGFEPGARVLLVDDVLATGGTHAGGVQAASNRRGPRSTAARCWWN